jgi:hypothetical protein
MTRQLAALLLCSALAGCSSTANLAYTAGFSFANVDAVAIASPANGSDSALYGLDILLHNALVRCHLQVLGEKDLEALPSEARARALVARLGLVTNGKRRLISLAFDGAASGKTVASLTVEARGDMLDAGDRADAFEPIEEALVDAVERDKGVELEG